MTLNFKRNLVQVTSCITFYLAGWTFPWLGVQLWGILLRIFVWPLFGNSELIGNVARGGAAFIITFITALILVLLMRRKAVMYSFCIALGALSHFIILELIYSLPITVLYEYLIEILFFVALVPLLTSLFEVKTRELIKAT
jgi:hypothetical protein